jgi:hypothetical protein
MKILAGSPPEIRTEHHKYLYKSIFLPLYHCARYHTFDIVYVTVEVSLKGYSQ